jgi:glycosyltransferase involved in cell wall biosynthesis
MVLNALTAQTYPSSRLDVVVVDNDSEDDTEAIVREAAARAPFPIQYARKANQGPAVARNYGAARTAGEIIAFTDSDCLPNSSWLSSAINVMTKEVGLVCGPIVPIEGPEDAILVHQVDGTQRDDGIYATANVLYRRTAFEQVGGFDAQFGAYAWGPPVGGEDCDLGWRVKRAGYAAAFAPMSVVYHQSSPMHLKGGLLDPLRAQVVPRLLVTIPELRRTFLWHRYFLGQHTAAFYLAALGIAVALRTRWGLLLVLPWLRIYWPTLRPHFWPPQRWPRLLLRLGLLSEASGLTSLVLAWASLRHRRLVL